MDRERASFTTSRVRSELDRSEASAIAEILSTRKVSTLRNYPCSAYLTRGKGTIALSNAKSRCAVKACSWAVCDIFAPAPSISATRSSITLAVSEGWESQPLGVSTAFCQADVLPAPHYAQLPTFKALNAWVKKCAFSMVHAHPAGVRSSL